MWSINSCTTACRQTRDSNRNDQYISFLPSLARSLHVKHPGEKSCLVICIGGDVEFLNHGNEPSGHFFNDFSMDMPHIYIDSNKCPALLISHLYILPISYASVNYVLEAGISLLGF